MKNLIYLISIYFLSYAALAADCLKPSMPSDQIWNEWLQDIKIEAKELGISYNTIENELSNVRPQKKIIMRDRCQPESRISLKEYLFYRLDKSRIFAGKEMMKNYKSELEKISNHFNIQPRFIVAILGLESFYGRNQGKIKTIDAVTTLAYDRRRSSFYKKQLFATLKIIDDKLVSSDKMKGSWGGAIGMTQMIPTTYLESAYDFDKDGFADIWTNYNDVFASVANYLTSINKNPWNKNITWGIEVIAPNENAQFYEKFKQINPKGCGAVKSRSIEKKLTEWDKLGFRDIDGNHLPDNNEIDARLVAPDGINGRMFLVYSNYKLFLYYNCSSYYAITIGLLSDEFKN